MKNLFDAVTVQQVEQRIAQLQPDSPRQWGTMSVSQMLAHCAAGFEMAEGTLRPPRLLIGRVIGRIIKSFVFRDDGPFRRNSATIKELIVPDEPSFTAERDRLASSLRRFADGGGHACTTHPHPFFGTLKPEEWAILMYKHVDHHLRQFSV